MQKRGRKEKKVHVEAGGRPKGRLRKNSKGGGIGDRRGSAPRRKMLYHNEDKKGAPDQSPEPSDKKSQRSRTARLPELAPSGSPMVTAKKKGGGSMIQKGRKRTTAKTPQKGRLKKEAERERCFAKKISFYIESGKGRAQKKVLERYRTIRGRGLRQRSELRKGGKEILRGKGSFLSSPWRQIKE